MNDPLSDDPLSDDPLHGEPFHPTHPPGWYCAGKRVGADPTGYTITPGDVGKQLHFWPGASGIINRPVRAQSNRID